jgi:hypothetical protein
MNFSEYEWDFTKPPLSDEPIYREPVKDQNVKSLSESLGIGCVGMECCSDGMTYDDVLSKCVSPTISLSSNKPADVPANAVTTMSAAAAASAAASTPAPTPTPIPAPAPAPKETPWKCLPGINVPLRRNVGGDIECMSNNNKDCLWKGTADECNNLIAKPPVPQNPLVCGAMHKKEWGSSGYDNTDHWCAKGQLQLSYKPIGCFGDKAERSMPILEGGDPSITGDYKTREDSIVKCYKFAKSKGYKYFGVQDGGHCQGSNNLAEAQKYGPSGACTNGKGGGWANDIYEIM